MRDISRWRKVLPIPLAGGMNAAEHRFFLRGRQFYELRNYRRTSGGLVPRPGWKRLSVDGSYLPAISAIGWCCGGVRYLKKDGTAVELLVGNNGKVYDLTQNPATALSYSGSATWSDAEACMAQWKDDCLIALGDVGTGKNLYYDASDGKLYDAGIDKPTGVSATPSGGGNIYGGVRFYRVLWYDAAKGWYSEPSDVVSVDFSDYLSTGGKATISHDAAPSWPRTLTAVYHVSDDRETWRVLEDSTDDTEDLTTLPLADARCDGEVVPACKYVLSTPGGMAFWANDAENGLPARVYRAYDATQPFTYGTYVDVGETGEPITGIIRWGDGVLVAKRESLHYVPLDASRSHGLLHGIGAVSHKSLVAVEGGVAFVAEDGIRFFNGQSAPFVGQDLSGPAAGARLFPLYRTWQETIDRDLLQHTFAAHLEEESIVLWFFRTDGNRNYSQIAIAWDYRRNELSIEDHFFWAAWPAPVENARYDRVRIVVPKGVVGTLGENVGDGAGATRPTWGTTGEGATATKLPAASVTEAEFSSGDDDPYVGSVIYLWDGTGKGQWRVVSSCDVDGDDVPAFYPDGAWDTIPDTTTKWMIGYKPLVFDLPSIGGGDEPGQEFQALDLDVLFAPKE